MSLETVKYERALTWRSILAIIFAAAVVQPLILYLTLIGSPGLIELSLLGFGGGFGIAYGTGIFLAFGYNILWVVVLLWYLLSEIGGAKLSAGEIFFIFAFYPMTISMTYIFLTPIFNLYVANSPFPGELGIKNIPYWWAPQGELADLTYLQRHLLSPGILRPVLLNLVINVVLVTIADISLGLFTYQRFVEVEKLEFPAQTANALAVLTLSGTERGKKRVLYLAATIGFMYNMFSWFFPYALGITVFRLFPRGLQDATSLIETKWPGAVFGVDTTLFTILAGAVIPFKVVFAMAITAIATYIFFNPYLVSSNIWVDWAPNMGLGWNYARSQMYWWTSVTIGFALAVALSPMILRPGSFARLFKSFATSSTLGLKLLLLGFLGSTSVAIIIFHILVPEFPLWILVFLTMGWSFLATTVSAESAGVTFGGFWVPYLKEFTIYYSGYRDVDAWFGRDFMLLSLGGANITGMLKMGSLCGVRPNEYLKGYLITVIATVIFGFLYVNILWQAAPIPSYSYPFTVSGWPIMALELVRWNKWLWMGILFKTPVILGSFVTGFALCVIANVLHLYWLPISILTGISMMPSIVLGQFIGGLINQIAPRFLGRWWEDNKRLLLVGIAIGDGIGITIGTVLLIISRSMWMLPY
ncbi:MAG: hypothetical protein QXL85_07450 [Candidatus Bathyarchaeia archaeon]